MVERALVVAVDALELGRHVVGLVHGSAQDAVVDGSGVALGLAGA